MFQQAGRPPRAADIIRSRKPKSALVEIRKILTGGKLTQQVDTPTAGVAPGTERGLQVGQGGHFERPAPPRKDPFHVRRETLKAQSQSPVFIEAIRRKLMGNLIGGLPTEEDRKRLELLERLEEEHRSGALGRQRERVRNQLMGTIGPLKRALLNLEKAGLNIGIGGIKAGQRALEAIEQLTTGDALSIKLRGMNLMPIEDVRTAPVTNPNRMRETPRQQRPMLQVASSNVYSLSFEPDDAEAPIEDESMGLLYITFRGGATYTYRVPYWAYLGVLRASSPGAAVWRILRRGLTPDGRVGGDLLVYGYERIR